MSGDLLLDSSVVVALLRGVNGIEQRLEQFDHLWLPVIALGELEIGVHLATRAKEQRAALDGFLPGVSLVTLSAETARHYARLRATLARAGTPIPENDLWIAAIAIEHQWPLATRDAHFTHVPGLNLLDWR